MNRIGQPEDYKNFKIVGCGCSPKKQSSSPIKSKTPLGPEAEKELFRALTYLLDNDGALDLDLDNIQPRVDWEFIRLSKLLARAIKDQL